MYAEWLGLPEERFEFVPMQFDNEFDVVDVDEDHPFVFATGSGFRDYGTFFDAVGRLGRRTLVLASDRVLDGLTVPAMADQLDRSVKSVEGLITRARREFRSVLDAAGNEQTGGGHG